MPTAARSRRQGDSRLPGEDRLRFGGAIGRGESTDAAALAAGVSSPVGYRWFRHAGGVKPTLPPAASGRYLPFPAREDIAMLKAQGHGVREIAGRTDRDASTISRELRRNASTRTYDLDYKASIVQWRRTTGPPAEDEWPCQLALAPG